MNDDERIKYLLIKMRNNTASILEKREYVDLLFSNNYINAEEYEEYKSQIGNNNKDLIDGLIGIGLAVFIGVLLVEIFKGK